MSVFKRISLSILFGCGSFHLYTGVSELWRKRPLRSIDSDREKTQLHIAKRTEIQRNESQSKLSAYGEFYRRLWMQSILHLSTFGMRSITTIRVLNHSDALPDGLPKSLPDGLQLLKSSLHKSVTSNSANDYRPVFTVMNHCSVADDPSLFANLLPSHFFLKRWCLCAETVCFKNELTTALFGAGQVLPIKRGNGIDQINLKHLRDRSIDGKWIHIFPEGKVIQSLQVEGTRHPQGVGGGKPYLHWGVAKVYLHSSAHRRLQRMKKNDGNIGESDKQKSIDPILFPIYHTGAEAIYPHDSRNKRKSYIPIPGGTVTFNFGQPLDVTDIVDEFLELEGKRFEERLQGQRRGSMNESTIGNARKREDVLLPWSDHDDTVDTEPRKVLYSSLMKRIHTALKDLEKETMSTQSIQ
eukprot:g3122.t1